jgi:ubiquinone/menaquinone biosynthesis C-methylase UbiE
MAAVAVRETEGMRRRRYGGAVGDRGGTERLRRLWNRYAPKYDRDIGVLERLQFAGGREWVCSQATGAVLEVAIGTGRNLPFYPPDARLTGVDLSPAMLGIARGRVAELGREVDLREGDAEALPFPDASFDTVVCTLGLCGIPDDRAAIAEMHRVLRPGGTLLLLDHIDSHHRLIHLGQRLLEKITLRFIGDYLTRRPPPLVRQAGFVVRRRERLKAGTVERLAATKPAG